MLIHSCLTVSSVANASLIFETILGFDLLYTFDIDAQVLNTLFHVNQPAHARVYELGNTRLEIFVMPDMPRPGPLQHICIGVPDRDAVVDRFASAGMNVRRVERNDGCVIFCIDHDGNLYELKPTSEC
ncbi:MAG TPA: VOC family protein [bacterium]|nr:VOC family protein [bacterium]